MGAAGAVGGASTGMLAGAAHERLKHLKELEEFGNKPWYKRIKFSPTEDLGRQISKTRRGAVIGGLTGLAGGAYLGRKAFSKDKTAMRLTPGRPPKPFQPRTPTTATDQATTRLSPIETKVAFDKDAGLFSRAGMATKKGLVSAGQKTKGLWQKVFKPKPPPPPQLSGLTAGAAGAGAGAIGLGALGAARAKPGERFQGFQRGAVLGAGLGGAGGLVARAPVNEILSQRHTAKLLKMARDKTTRGYA